MPDAARVIGLMSGTSLDGVDAVLADFASPPGRLLAKRFLAYDDQLRADALALNFAGDNEIDRAGRFAVAVTKLYARAVNELLADAGVASQDVFAIGCHGQTVRHRPDLGYTIQLSNPALLAELTGISVVADFRSRDIASGGQGAPLVPAFHAVALRSASSHRVIVNIGGIANVTDLPPAGAVRGFDTGPGNVLLDLWTETHLAARFDADGAWASGGRVLPRLLAAMLREPYFELGPPKSTGRDLFNRAWLDRYLDGRESPQDVQATLAELTARSIADAIERHCANASEVFVCGGGAHNRDLIERLRRLCGTRRVATTAAVGIDPDWIEAVAFAWLAWRHMQGLSGNLPEVTGASGPRILGAFYPR